METFLYAPDRVAGAVLASALERQGLSHQVVADPEGIEPRALLIVCAPWVDEATWGGVRAFIEAGGRALFAQPELHALSLIGEAEPLSYPFPLLKTEGGFGPYVHLQVLSPTTLVRQRHGEALACYSRDFSDTAKRWSTRYPAVASGALGLGQWAVFTYDLPRTLLAFHQGHPCFASTGDFPDPLGDGKYRSTHLIFEQVAPELRGVPQAQGHETMLLGVARRLCDDLSPLPRLWPLPYPNRAAMVLSGDSDSLDGDRIHFALDRLGAWGLPYTLYTMPEDLLKLSQAAVDEYQQRGVDFGLHYYHGLTAGVDAMATGLRADLEVFGERHLRPTSARGHSCIWVGWDEQARLLAENGFTGSSNFLGRLAYSNGTGLPYGLIGRDGERLPIVEVPMYAGDDVSLSDKWGLPQLTAGTALAQTLAGLEQSAALYYQPLTFCFHPHYFSGTEPATTPWLEGLADYARRGCPVYNVAEWLAYASARAGVRLQHSLSGTELMLSKVGSATRMGVAVPDQWRGLPCRTEGIALAGTDELLMPLEEGMRVRYG